MITCTISILTSICQATWDKGQLGGDPGAVGYIRALARILEGREVGLPGMAGTTTNHLANARSFIALCAMASDVYPTSTVVGAEPDLQPANLPEGTVA